MKRCICFVFHFICFTSQKFTSHSSPTRYPKQMTHTLPISSVFEEQPSSTSCPDQPETLTKTSSGTACDRSALDREDVGARFPFGWRRVGSGVFGKSAFPVQSRL